MSMKKINPYNLSIDKGNSIDNRLDVAANLSQFYSLFLLLKDASNNEIMEELNNQNKKYLEKIIEQNDRIIELLEKRV